MSYNILNKNVNFQGSTQGTIEDIVDLHTDQTIGGKKTVTLLTASNLSVTNKLGIGLTDPETSLHIKDGSAGSIATTAGALLTLESNEKPKIHFQSPNAYGGSIIFGSVTDNDEGQIDYDHGSDRFLFKTGGNTKMTILGSNVGIGTTSPSTKLHVNGNITTINVTSSGTITAESTISSSGPISGSKFFGDGSALSGVGVSLASNGGLANSSGLLVDPGNATEITVADDNDYLLVRDNTDGNLKKIKAQYIAGLANAGVTQMNDKAENRLVTIASSTTQLDGEANLTFDGTDLSLEGNLSGSGNFQIGGTIRTDGLPVEAPNYSQDHILFIDATDSLVTKSTFGNFAATIAGDGLVNNSGRLEVQVSGAVKVASDKVGITGSFAGNGLIYDGGVDSISKINVRLQNNSGLFVETTGLKTNFATLTSATPDVAADSIPFIDSAGDAKCSINTFLTQIAGSGISVSGNQLTAAGGGGAVSAVADGADNRITTFSSSDALSGEVNLQFDGTTLSINGAEGDAGVYSKIVVRKVGIADNSATAVVRFTIPNANHAACFKIFGFVTTDSGSRVGTFEQSVAISRVTDSVAVAGTASGILSTEANSGGGGADYTIASTTTQSGGASASNTIDYNLVVNTTDSSTTSAVFYVELLNFNSTGVTMAAV